MERVPRGHGPPYTWGTHIYPLDRVNGHGRSYKQTLTPAIQEIARCLKQGIPYDVIPDGPRFDLTGYERILWVQEDGTTIVTETK